jgi:pimeloyl-ACP methyl ester carboxylesterase
MRASFVEVDGVRVRCLHAGGGPALLLLHPIGHSADVFFRNIDALAVRFSVVAPDLPGHGFSEVIDFAGEPPQRRTVPHLARLMTTLGHEHFSVLGSSYGALLAALLCLAEPARAQKLVIVGSGSVFHPAAEQRTLLQAVRANVGRSLTELTLDSCRERLAAICHSPDAVAEEILLARLTSYALPDRAAAFAATIEGLMASGPEDRVYERLETIATPTLVIVGREDIRADWRLHEEGSRRMPDARCVVIDSCGHLPSMEYPERLNQLVHDFGQQA